MSWSVYAVGKPARVLEVLRTQFDGSKCAEPEETVRQAAKTAILEAVQAQRLDSVVKVAASGSMAQSYNESEKKWGAPLTNNLQISIEPVCILEGE